MRVRAYRNLHRGGYSIMSMEKGDRYMRVIAHLPSLMLEECCFIVREAGAKKARETGVRNVHAFIEGNLCEVFKPRGQPYRITYEPFGQTSRFVVKENGEDVDEAAYVHLTESGAYAFF